MRTKKSTINEAFAALASKASAAAGSVWAFGAAVATVLVWAGTGPVFGYSEVWQLVINTGTTIIAFLMVFVIQHAQNRDTRAVHLKLNELIAAVEGASNRLIDVEDLSEGELDRLYQRFQRLAQTSAKVSSGAKLTVDDDVECSGEDCADGDKNPVHVKAEARGRKRASRHEPDQESL